MKFNPHLLLYQRFWDLCTDGLNNLCSPLLFNLLLVLNLLSNFLLNILLFFSSFFFQLYFDLSLDFLFDKFSQYQVILRILQLRDAFLCYLLLFNRITWVNNKVVQMVCEMFEAIILRFVIVLSQCSLPQEYVRYSQLWRDLHRVLWVIAQVDFSFFDLLVFKVTVLLPLCLLLTLLRHYCREGPALCRVGVVATRDTQVLSLAFQQL